jgi:hypothetical protein
LSPAHHQQLPAISSPLPSPQWLAFDRLHPHPGNPRLFDREEVIEGIAQSLRSSGFDPAHALIVRPLGDDWQIISGHHRRRASERAELDRIPCWVRELDDATAYMMLVTCNAQSGLTALEYGLHALRVTEKHSKLGKSINATRRRSAGRGNLWKWKSMLLRSTAQLPHVGHLLRLTDRGISPRSTPRPHGCGRRWSPRCCRRRAR